MRRTLAMRPRGSQGWHRWRHGWRQASQNNLQTASKAMPGSCVAAKHHAIAASPPRAWAVSSQATTTLRLRRAPSRCTVEPSVVLGLLKLRFEAPSWPWFQVLQVRNIPDSRHSHLVGGILCVASACHLPWCNNRTEPKVANHNDKRSSQPLKSRTRLETGEAKTNGDFNSGGVLLNVAELLCLELPRLR